MMKYFGRLLLVLLLFSGMTSCTTKQRLMRSMKKEQQFVRKMERKEFNRTVKSYKKEYRAWYKQQPKEMQKKLKEQKRQTKKFYKPYGKACTNVTPGKTPKLRSKYKKDGIK
jgi:phenylalanyl-tRNA synthetase alpha subunit